MVANYLVDQNVRVSTASNGREMARVLTAGWVDSRCSNHLACKNRRMTL